MPRKIVRSSGPRTTSMAAPCCKRWTSCTGTLTDTSTTPDNKDEVRVASDLIGINTTLVRLCRGFLSHQCGLARNSVLTSTSRDFTMKGPVPLVWRLAEFSFFCMRWLASVALFASDQDLLITRNCTNSFNRVGNGAWVSISTVY